MERGALPLEAVVAGLRKRAADDRAFAHCVALSCVTSATRAKAAEQDTAAAIRAFFNLD